MEQVHGLLESDTSRDYLRKAGVGDQMQALALLYWLYWRRVIDTHRALVCSNPSFTHFTLKILARLLKHMHLKIITRVKTLLPHIVPPLHVPEPVQRTHPSVIRPRIINRQQVVFPRRWVRWNSSAQKVVSVVRKHVGSFGQLRVLVLVWGGTDSVVVEAGVGEGVEL